MRSIVLICLCVMMISGGCSATGSRTAFDKDGLPKQQYYVGGGFDLNYRAPGVRGTVYVVEENSRKLVVTESLDKLQVFEFNIDPRDEDVHMRLKTIGIDPLNLKFGLYFVPQSEQNPQSSASHDS